jgi:hypothetical protein
MLYLRNIVKIRIGGEERRGEERRGEKAFKLLHCEIYLRSYHVLPVPPLP